MLRSLAGETGTVVTLCNSSVDKDSANGGR